MAQIGSSCSYPYVMNLSNGAGNGEFQFHYPDTVMYIKVENVTEKEILTLRTDSNSIFEINHIYIKSNNCSGNFIIDRTIEMLNFKRVGILVNFSMEDTVLLCVRRSSYNTSCNGCDSLNNRIYISFNSEMGNPLACNQPTYCDNLVLNGGMEYYNPLTITQFVAPWYNTQYDNIVCGYEAGVYLWDPNDPGTINNTSPDYYNSIFDGLSGSTFGFNHNTFGISNQNAMFSLGGCGSLLPEQNNPFFPINPSNSFSYNNAFGGESFGINTELLRASLDPGQPLINGHLYFIQGSFGARNFNQYSANIEMDLHANLNYVESYYVPSQTSPPPVSMTIETFAPNLLLDWSTFNAIYIAQGNETSLWIGNLRKLQTNVIQNPAGNVTCSDNFDYYYFDNFVVKEFVANAGPNTVTACEGEGVQLGPLPGSICPIPNTLYSWTPAQYFNDPTLANPTFIAPAGSPATIQVTLTVSINTNDGVLGNVVTYTTSSTVDITIIQGSSITITGPTTVITGGSTTLNLINGTNYSWTGSDGSSGFSATNTSIVTGPLYQDVTYTINATSIAGCSVTEIITITVSNVPQACQSVLSIPNTISIPDGYTSTDLKNFMFTNYPTYITMASNNGNGSYSYNISSPANLPLTFLLEGTFTIDNTTGLNFSFANNFIGTPPPPDYSNFYCVDGSTIINNSYLTMTGCSLVACNNMWKGITNNKNLYLNGCYFADAEYAVHLANGSNYKISTNVFDNNLYGILMGGIGGGQITGVDYSNLFTSTNPLKPAFTTMFFHPTWSEAGIKVHNVNYVQIGAVPAALANFGAATISNRFENINCGINIFNSNVKVVNSWFKDLTNLNPSPMGTLIGLQPEGSGIYARSIGTPKSLSVEPIPGYSGNEFENCKYGIKTFRNSIIANNIRMNNVANGITAQNSIMCSYNLQSNRINAWLNGIDINNAEFANNIVVAYNQINMNFLMGYFGINVTGATSGNVGNTRINNNIVTIANTYNAGIQTSSLKGSLVNCNTIRRMVTNPINPWYSLNGINSLTCDNITLSQNTVNWAPGFIDSPNMGNDILLELSDEAMVRCNTTGASRIGLQVAGSNPNSTIRANNFGSNDIALRYDNSGVTGPQPADPLNDETEGNRWLGTNTFKAFNAAQTPDVNQSIYYVNVNQPANNYPDPQLIFPQGWFDGSGRLTYQAPCLIQNCAGRMASSVGNTDFYRSIANRSLRTNGYPEQTLWMAQNTLVRLLTNDTILLNNDDSLHYFYYSPDAQSLRAIEQIGRNNNAFEAQRNLYSNAIIANDSLLSILETQYLSLNGQLTDSLANDSLILMQKIALLAQYESLKLVNENLGYDLDVYHRANLSIANDLNRALEPRNANEQILKTVNEIYFTLRDNDYEYISNDDATMLAYIAHLCPLAAGPAVFKARDLYALLVDSVLYQDSANCNREGYARESLTPFAPKLKNQVVEFTYFKAFPVPAQNTLNLSFNELKSAASVYVYDMEGRLLLSKNISSNSRNEQLELSQLPAGVYYVLLINSERAERTKISVIK